MSQAINSKLKREVELGIVSISDQFYPIEHPYGCFITFHMWSLDNKKFFHLKLTPNEINLIPFLFKVKKVNFLSISIVYYKCHVLSFLWENHLEFLNL